jgi:hypothetical protein
VRGRYVDIVMQVTIGAVGSESEYFKFCGDGVYKMTICDNFCQFCLGGKG